MMLPLSLASALFLGLAVAHGDAAKELSARSQFLAVHTNNLSHCAKRHQETGLDERAIQRRAKAVRALTGNDVFHVKRQTSSLDKSHQSTEKYNITTDSAVVFGGKPSCVLSPETTEGPFFVDGGGIRSQLIDDQVGVPVYLDIQVIDVNTCEPLQDTFLEMWNANSTGIYSGAISSANGNANDKSNLNKVFLRGAQKTNKDGAVQFATIFPGHYQGRATHIHIISHHNDSTTVFANNTIWGTRVTHNGQAFFDQSLINAVEKLSPYSTNRQARTQNKADAILLQEAATSDPFFHYVQLGTDLKRDGIFAWFTFGVNSTLTRDIMAVAKYYASGGQVVTTNPKLPGFSAMFPGGFPTAWQPGFGPSPTMTPVTVTTKRA